MVSILYQIYINNSKFVFFVLLFRHYLISLELILNSSLLFHFSAYTNFR